VRTFGSFDEKLAHREGSTLEDLKKSVAFANGRELKPEEEMRVVYFEQAHAKIRL